MYTPQGHSRCTTYACYEPARSSSDSEYSEEDERQDSYSTSHDDCTRNVPDKEVIESLQARLQHCELLLQRLSSQQLEYDCAVERRLALMQDTLDEALATRKAYMQECVQQLRRRCAEAWQQQRDALDELSCELAACTRVQLCKQQQEEQQQEKEEVKEEEITTTTVAMDVPCRPALQGVHTTATTPTCNVPSPCQSASYTSSCSVSSGTHSGSAGDDFITPSPPYATRASSPNTSHRDGYHNIHITPAAVVMQSRQDTSAQRQVCTTTTMIEECDMSAESGEVARVLTQDTSFTTSPGKQSNRNTIKAGVHPQRQVPHDTHSQSSAYFTGTAIPVLSAPAADERRAPRIGLREVMQRHRRTWQRQMDEALAEAYIAGQP